MEVNLEKEPAEGEVHIFTSGGGFVVKGSVKDVTQKLTSEAWASFELVESGDRIVLRSDKVVALRGGTSKTRRGSIGFAHRES